MWRLAEIELTCCASEIMPIVLLISQKDYVLYNTLKVILISDLTFPKPQGKRAYSVLLGFHILRFGEKFKQKLTTAEHIVKVFFWLMMQHKFAFGYR